MGDIRMSEGASQWEGIRGATEHRTAGARAWCFQDQTWCYPIDVCRCCLEVSTNHKVCPTCDGEGYVRVDDPTTNSVQDGSSLGVDDPQEGDRPMSLPETIWWCDFHRVPDRYVGADPDNRQCWKRYMGNPGRCELVELRVAGPDDLLIRREADGSWPDWVLDGLGWEVDDSHDLSAVMDGVWRERPRAAAEGGTDEAS